MNDDLPPLPETAAYYGGSQLFYSAGQMRDYARAALEGPPGPVETLGRDNPAASQGVNPAPLRDEPGDEYEEGIAQAFYKDADAEPPYAQFARGVKEGFELGRRNAMQDAANARPSQPPREPLTLSDEEIDAIPLDHIGLANGRHGGMETIALRKFARAVLAAAQGGEKP
jgi:hypothetical protein